MITAAENDTQGATLRVDRQELDANDNTDNIKPPGQQQQEQPSARPAPVNSFASTRNLDISRHLGNSGDNSEGDYDQPIKSSRRDRGGNGNSRVGGGSRSNSSGSRSSVSSSSREREMANDKNRDNNAGALRDSTSKALLENNSSGRTRTLGENLPVAAVAAAAALQSRKHEGGEESRRGSDNTKISAIDRLDDEIASVDTGGWGWDEDGDLFEFDDDELEEFRL